METRGRMEGKKKETKVTRKREECEERSEVRRDENEKQKKENVLPFDRIRSFWSIGHSQTNRWLMMLLLCWLLRTARTRTIP